jgi:predicted dienelactone hydrolase
VAGDRGHPRHTRSGPLRDRLRVLRPGARAWRGAWIGTIATASLALLAAGGALRSGRGIVVDAVTALAVGWLAIGLVVALLLGVARLLRGVPPRLRAVGLVAILATGTTFALAAGPWGLAIGLLLVVGGAVTGAGVTSLARHDLAWGPPTVAAVAGAAVGLVLLGGTAAWLVADDRLEDPGDPPPSGPYEVVTLTYGSGEHRHRPGFGADADVVTPVVDGSAYLERWRGLRGWLRTRYWGFGPDALPLNATVWYPDAPGPHPLVLVVHGNAPMEVASDRGYDWLAVELASRGHVVASVDQNFLNLSYTRGFGLAPENDARAWLLLEHLRLWQRWQGDPDHRLHGTADLERIALIGHSRGGEAAAVAAAFDRMRRYPEDATLALDTGFDIDAVVALSPVDGQYEPAGRPTTLEDVSYLTVHGGRDGDVSSFVGLRQYHRVAFTGERFAAKAAVWLEDANHGQFNTVWGRRDVRGLAGRVLDTAGLMPPHDQRAAARTAIVPFLEAVFAGEPDGLEHLHDATAAAWPDTTRVVTRYADSTFTVLADHDEDADPATATLPRARIHAQGLEVWRQQPVPLRAGEQHTNAAVLGWAHEPGMPRPTWAIRLPPGYRAPEDPVLWVSIADTGEAPTEIDLPATEPIDITVEIVDSHGWVSRATVRDLGGGVPVAPRSRRLKGPLPDWAGNLEPVAQTFRMRLADHAQEGFDPARIAEVRLVFDREPAGLVLVHDVAIAPGP